MDYDDSVPPDETGPETAREIARAVRAGDNPPAAAVARSLSRIRALDGAIGAFLSVRGEDAVAEARGLGRRADLETLPLAGVPVAVKDNLAVAGLPVTGGSRAAGTVQARADARVVARLRAAGAVVVGKTALPELGVWATTDGAWGETRSPANPDCTAGGSSGGSAAAVAAGMTPLAIGNDGLGSVRIPAACCGVVGLKLSTGVAPTDLAGGDWYGMAVNGPIAGTVDDVALAAAVLAHQPALDPGFELARLGPRRFRVALSTRTPLPGGRVDPEWVAAVQDAGDRLRGLGHRVVEVDPPYAASDVIPVFARWFAGVARAVDALDADWDRLQRRTRTHALLGRWVRRLGGPRDGGRQRAHRRLGAFLDRYDVLITPALAAPPIPALPWHRRSWLANITANARYAPFSAAWNLVGAPAGVLPAGRHSDGSPLSLQVVAAHGHDARVLAVMRVLESALDGP